MKKKDLKRLLVFVIIFLLLLVVSIFQTVDNDQVWSYGFSYNIARGLIPYKDYNMIIGPIYSLIFSLPMLIFGNYIIIYKIFHIIVYSLILTFAYEKIGNRTVWLIAACAIQSTFCWYNIFCAFLTIIILMLLDSKNKYKNIIIGILIGIIIMTKHNIGGALFIVYFFTTKNKKEVLSVSIPIIISLIYLLCTNSLLGYIDLCILGMGGFIGNLRVEFDTLALTIILLIYYIKRYIKTKDVKILYILSFMIVIFPLIEKLHFLIGIVPIVYYITVEEQKNIIYKAMQFFVVLGLIYPISQVPKTEIILDNNPYIFNSLYKGVNYAFSEYSKYIKKIDGNVYLFTQYSYNYKIYNNNTTNFYDLINKGNLGKNPDKYIKELEKKCSKEKCTFIVDYVFFEKDRKEGLQLLRSFKDYVVDNYDYIETLPSEDRVYNNKKRINK